MLPIEHVIGIAVDGQIRIFHGADAHHSGDVALLFFAQIRVLLLHHAHGASFTLVQKVDEFYGVIRYPEVLEEVTAAGLPNQLCQYAYELSAAYMSFYEQCPILRDDVPRPTMKSRLLLSYLTAKTLKSALHLLGIQTTQRM